MTTHDRPTVTVLGLRGIPDVQGGIETHVRMLYPLIVRLGYAVNVIQRLPYFPGPVRRRRWHGIDLVYLWSPTASGVETALHTFLGILYAAIKRPALLHLHGIGPAFLTPLARIFGLSVIVTHHTFDYRREKWGWLAKTIFSVGEYLGMRFANGRIVVSEDIARHVRDTYGVTPVLAPNGARMAVRTGSTDALEGFGLEPSKYVLCVARLETTKRHLDLIAAFERAETLDWRLAIVGGIDPDDEYTRTIMEAAKRNAAIVLTDFQTGRALRELYSHAGLFALCSSHEGQPIALLEALGYGLPCCASAIPANRVVPLPDSRFFDVGDVARLSELIETDVVNGVDAETWRQVRARVRKLFDWKVSARRTSRLYDEVLGRRSRGS